MHRCAAILLLVAGVLTSALPARAQGDTVLSGTTPLGHYITVAAGPREAASIGSYAVREYGAKNPRFKTDDFITGIVLQRDGSSVHIMWQDVLGDGGKELVVVSFSAGTGGYLNADALRLNGKTIALIASVRGLDPKADVVKALRAATRRKAR